jgi:isopenicillin N synthase-like dioxygenase
MTISTEPLEYVQCNGGKVPVYEMETISFERILSQEPTEVERLVRCCQTEGYFYIDLQGIDGRRLLEDQQKTLDLMHRFFESPIEAKNQFGLVSPHLGYAMTGSWSIFVGALIYFEV